MTEKEAEFVKELQELCKRHEMVAVPSHDYKPSAHDPMLVVPLDEFWWDFLQFRVYGKQDIEG